MQSIRPNLWCRRLRTGRPKDGKDEVRPKDLPWLPLDERFNNEKNHGVDLSSRGLLYSLVLMLLDLLNSRDENLKSEHC